jgi:leucyl-tRNA synthetase
MVFGYDKCVTEYNHKKIESKWQKKWTKEKAYHTKDKSKKSKYYVLDMFPYPSGEGLHVGHPKGFIATDVISRMKRMQGHNVLHPMGFDAFGLPAENFALKKKIHPEVAVKKNIKRFKDQLGVIGLDYDWSREVVTTDPKYYKWTQWIFLQLYKKGLVYESYEPINWCPSCKTGLANEDLEGGNCERCGTQVEKKPVRQWVLKITDYADRMLEDLDLKGPDGSPLLSWPEPIKEMQRNWIGKSEGINLKCKVKDVDISFEAYDSVPQTYMAQTFTVIAPDHTLLKKLVEGTPQENEVLTYAKKMLKEKQELGEEYVNKIDGIFTGRYVWYEPAKRDLPIWVASFAISGYGSGFVNCSAHDERDFAFAKKYSIPLHEVSEPLVVRNQGADAIRENEPFVERNAVVCVIKHWSENKFLCHSVKNTDWLGFVVGGIENGETPEQTGLREIIEETGYKNVKFIKKLGSTVHSQFWQDIKKQNRFAHFTPLYFELQNGEQGEIEEIQEEFYDIHWVLEKEVIDLVSREDMKMIWERKLGIEKPIIKNGILTEPEEFKGREWNEVREDIIDYIVKKKWGARKTNYKLRDWVFSRQRYWGEPIPLVFCEHCAEQVKSGKLKVKSRGEKLNPGWFPDEDLPVELPKVKSYEPTGTGESPLASISKWVNVKCPECGGGGRRETNTMPQWAGSSWYYLRYMDPKNTKALVDKKKEKYWNSVDLYVGGAEHATRHLIYARFWHKFLYDIGVVSTLEPFARLQSVGLIGGADGRKMSKRFGNVINPDDIVKTYGADTLRLYEMFMGPFSQAIAWSDEAIIGPRRFLEKVWKIGDKVASQTIEGPRQPASSLRESASFSVAEKLLHKTIKKVTEDIESMHSNTAISSMMILASEMESTPDISTKDFKMFLQILAPFAPHITEELWRALGEKRSIHLSPWPKWDKGLIKDDEIKIAVQVNGKVRAEVMIQVNESEDSVRSRVISDKALTKYMSGKKPKRVIYVKNRLINIVI